MDVISRETWGARPPSQPLPLLTNPVRTVYVHHQGGGLWLVNDQQEEMANLRGIQAAKMSEGYSDFPYHPAVYPSGRVYEGREEKYEGGATYTQNALSRSVLWPGNYNLQAVTKKQLLATAAVVRDWISRGLCTEDVTILGHKQAPGNSTACPGVHAMRALKDLTALVHIDVPDLGDDVPKASDVTGSLRTEHGEWDVTYDGGILTRAGQFHGSYPGLPSALRQGTRGFYVINARDDGRAGYELVATDGSRYVFPTG